MIFNKIIVLFCISTLIWSCQTDKKYEDIKDPKEIAALEQYMEDYEEPRYKWGYIDTTGVLILENDFDDCRDFNEGHAVINVKGRWGLVNKSGSLVILPKWKLLRPVSEGIAIAKSFANVFYGLTISGDTLFSLEAEEIYSFSEGRSRFKYGGLTGFINASGEEVVTPQYLRATDFKNGYSAVQSENGWNLIRPNGVQVYTQFYEKTYPPINGMARIKNDNTFAFLPSSGLDKRPSFDYQSAGNFYEGFAVVKKNNQIGLLDQSMQFQPSEYDHLEYAQQGRWMCIKEGKYGFIDYDQIEIVPPQYDMAYHYSEDLCAIEKQGLWGYIDLDGGLVKDPFSPLVWSFHNGLARVIFRNGVGFVNADFEEVTPRRFYEVRDFNDGLARVQVYR